MSVIYTAMKLQNQFDNFHVKQKQKKNETFSIKAL